jgi:hypothetical protein
MFDIIDASSWFKKGMRCCTVRRFLLVSGGRAPTMEKIISAPSRRWELHTGDTRYVLSTDRFSLEVSIQCEQDLIRVRLHCTFATRALTQNAAAGIRSYE